MELARLPASVTLIPSLFVEAAVAVRNLLYDRGLINAAWLPAPVISVGNLTVGGTGKTPLVIHIAGILSAAGRVPALLSRGYGRRSSSGPVVIPPEQQAPDSALTLGDEPSLVRRRVPGIWLGIDGVRLRAGNSVLRREPGAVFVLDDGFQHRSLRRTLDIVVVDRSQPLTGNHLIPRGTLRERPAALRRAHAIVLSGRPYGITAHGVERDVRTLASDIPMFQLRTSVPAIVPFPRWAEGATGAGDSVRPARAFLAAAIGNPARFRADIVGLGITVTGERFFRDHASPGKQGWAECGRQAERFGADWVLTTEKDAIKIAEPPPFPLAVCVQSARVDDAAAFAGLILEAAGRER